MSNTSPPRKRYKAIFTPEGIDTSEFPEDLRMGEVDFAIQRSLSPRASGRLRTPLIRSYYHSFSPHSWLLASTIERRDFDVRADVSNLRVVDVLHTMAESVGSLCMARTWGVTGIGYMRRRPDNAAFVLAEFDDKARKDIIDERESAMSAVDAMTQTYDVERFPRSPTMGLGVLSQQAFVSQRDNLRKALMTAFIEPPKFMAARAHVQERIT